MSVFSIAWLCIAFIFPVFLAGCARHAPLVTEVDPIKMPPEITIRNWQLIGPFHFSKESIAPANPAFSSGGLNHDYLAELGYPEAAFGETALKGLSSHRYLHPAPEQSSNYLLFHKMYPGMEYAVIYAVAVISSAADGDVGISVGSDDGVKLWINGKLIVATSNTIVRAAARYQNVSIAHLRRGNNYVLAKVDQKTGTWQFSMDLMSLDRSHQIFEETQDEHVVANRLLRPGESVRISYSELTLGTPLRFRVQNPSGRTVYSYEIPANWSGEVNLPKLPEDVYDCTLDFGTFSLHDAFYVGDPDGLYRRLVRSRRIRSASKNRTAYLEELDGMIRRYEILTAANHRLPDSPNWQRKVLMVLRDGEAAMHAPAGSRWLQAPGWHFREFISPIDGQPQDYLLFLPHSRLRPKPVVFSVPPDEQTPRTFLESALITDSDYLWKAARVADKASVGFVLFSGRGNYYSAPIGDAGVLEVVKDVRKNYDIDADRMYLYGNCSSAGRALHIAEHHPGIFAAVGTYRAFDSSYHNRAPEYVWWISHENEGALAGNLINTPVLLAYGDSDDAYPLAMAQKFSDAVSRAGARVRFQVLKGMDHANPYFLDPIGSVLPFLAGQRLQQSPHTIQITASRLKYANTPGIRITGFNDPMQSMKLNASLNANQLTIKTDNVSQLEIRPGRLGVARGTALRVDWNGARSTTLFQNTPIRLGATPTSTYAVKSSNVEGPMADVFAGPFEVVTGTGGTPAEQRSALAATASFTQAWRGKFFVDCRHKLDTGLTPDDIKNFNLVLIGKPAGQGTLGRVMEKLPIVVQPTDISIGGRRYDGQALGFALAFPNPLNRKHYLALIDANTSTWKLPDYDLVFGGFSDYIVWDENGSVLHSGVFGPLWRQAIPFS